MGARWFRGLLGRVVPTAVIPRACGGCSTPRLLGSFISVSGILGARSSRAMTTGVAPAYPRHCERSEAIHSFFARRDGLLRFARNDGDPPYVRILAAWFARGLHHCPPP